MDLIVRQGDREEKVRVRRIDGGFEVTVGDRVHQVDALPARPGLLSLGIDGSHHEAAVRRQKEGVYWVSTAQGAGPVEVLDPLAHLAAQSHGSGGKRRQRVDAYMPGRVVAVLVEKGAEVTTGQGIVVLEAMKMENEISAEHDGKIGKVYVQPGQAVDTGSPLFELE